MDSISIKINEDGTGIVEIDSVMTTTEKLGYLESSIDYLQEAKKQMSKAANLIRNAGYTAMAGHYKSIADEIERRSQENLKEQNILQSNITQTRLI